MADIKTRISEVNARLKAGGARVTILQRGERLWLQATFPPKPHIKKDKPYQQKISLGVNATPAGLANAERKAKLISAQLDDDKFNWADWLDEPEDKPAQRTVQQWIIEFERDHWVRTKRSPEALTTWKTDYLATFKKLPSDQLLTIELLLEAIARTEPDSRSRKRVCDYLSKLAKFANLPTDKIKTLTGNYSSASVSPRSLPSDALIAEWRSTIKSDGWRWVVGMMAAYGLRNHEVFYVNINSDNFPQIEVLEGKSGGRLVYPLYPEWPTQWSLDQICLPNLENIDGLSHAKLGSKVSGWFLDNKAPCKPYDLRHSYARRCFEFNISPDWAAGMMGHSAAVHIKTYRAWIDHETYRKAYALIIQQPNRPLPPL